MSNYRVYPSDAPRCWPRAAGAIGAFEPTLAQAVAKATEPSLNAVDAGPGASLWLDREPLRWSGGSAEGWAWSEGLFAPDGVNDWRSASRRLGACGLVRERKLVHLHSSVAGAIPLYYRAIGGAVYFSTRIDALATALPGTLSVDWEAWSSIFCLSFPAGDRTPFADIKRLRPFATLAATRKGPEVVQHDWPWAEVEPVRTRAEALPDVLEAMRAAIAPLAERPVVSALSGGWDSRLILSLLLEHNPRPEIEAFTVNTDVGKTTEEDPATAVADAAGVSHEVVIGKPGAYWDEFCERYRRSEYQRQSNAWLVTLSRRIAGTDGFVTDAVATAVLSVDPSEKFEGELYHDLLEAANPKLAALPSTHEIPSGGPSAGFQRRVQPAVVAEYQRVLERSPLRPLLAKRITDRIEDGQLGEMLGRQRPHWRIAVIVMFSLWAERYRDQLGEIDTSPLSS
ncbi:hypothetical protein BH10ACT11_BH10ACT11_21920 [soil metagenome]